MRTTPDVADVQPLAVDLHALATDLDARTWTGHDTLGRTGARISVLFEDEATGQRVALIRCIPGAASARHRHEGHESFLILEGTFVDESGSYGKGQLVVYPPGSQHSWTTPDGGLFYVVWGGGTAAAA